MRSHQYECREETSQTAVVLSKKDRAFGGTTRSRQSQARRGRRRRRASTRSWTHRGSAEGRSRLVPCFSGFMTPKSIRRTLIKTTPLPSSLLLKIRSSTFVLFSNEFNGEARPVFSAAQWSDDALEKRFGGESKNQQGVIVMKAGMSNADILKQLGKLSPELLARYAGSLLNTPEFYISFHLLSCFSYQIIL